MPLDLTVTYDPSTQLGQVRLTILDVDTTSTPPATGTPRGQWSVLFLDQEIQFYLGRYGALDSYRAVQLASADLLVAIASNAALLEKHIALSDLVQDTKGVAKALMEQAKYLRHMEDDLPADAMSTVWYTPHDWTADVIRQWIQEFP